MIIKRLCLFLVLILLSNAIAKRSLTLLEVQKGPGINTENVKFFEAMLLNSFKQVGYFDIKNKAIINNMIKNMGGCNKKSCYFSAAEELGIDLLGFCHLRKKRNQYFARLTIADTKLEETVMQYTEELPGEIMFATEDWVNNFLAKTEHISTEAEKIEIKENNRSSEAANATIIMEDEIQGTLTKDKSPYLILKNIIIPANKTLKIEKGVTMLMGGGYSSIVVYGQLMINGTKNEPVTIKSSKKNPKLWDWDRIYIRSRARSFISNCIISHSNFGIHVDNGNVTISECMFKNNSISCIYTENSNVNIRNTNIYGGHIIGINVDEGSVVKVDSGYIQKNNNAVLCHNYSRLEMTKTRIENNNVGIVSNKKAFIELRDIYVKKNKIGVLTQKSIDKKKLFMIKDNEVNIKVVNAKEYVSYIRTPEKITAIKVREKAFKDTTDFKTKFESVPLAGESFTARLGLIGQVSMGLSYRKIDDLNGDVHKNFADSLKPHQSTYVPGFRPEIQIYMQSKVGDRESNLTISGYGNYNDPNFDSNKDYLSSLQSERTIGRLDLFNFTTSLPGQDIVLGDFSEDKSEISISSRQIRGLRYNKYFDFKKGRKLNISILGGQSEVPYEIGFKPDMLDSTTTAERQEWLGMLKFSSNINPDLKIGGHLIGTRHLDDPILTYSVDLDNQDLYGADPKLKSLNWGINTKLIFNNNYSGYAEIAAGYADTLSVDVDSGETSNKAYSKDTLIHYDLGENNIAGMLGMNFSVKGFSGNLEYINVQDRYYSGGNPSIMPSVGSTNKAKFRGSKIFEFKKGLIENMELNTSFDWEAVGTEETDIDVDFLGENKLYAADSAEYDSIVNDESLELQYFPTENRLKAGIDFKIPVLSLRFEPDFSYYYERKKLFKRDAKSENIEIEVNDKTKKIDATEYIDSEARIRGGLGIVYIPSIRNDYISNVRINVSGTYIKINDYDDKAPATTYSDTADWSKNQGYQMRLKGKLSSKFFDRRFGNKIRVSYKYKEKKYKNETYSSYRIEDDLNYNVIPRRISLDLKGYYRNTVTNYKEDEIDSEGDYTGNINKIKEAVKVYGAETNIRFSISSTFSFSVKGGYEYGYDDAESGGENYKTYYGGGTFNLLF